MNVRQRFAVLVSLLIGFWLASPAQAQDEASLPKEQRISLSGGPVVETNFSGFYHSGVEGGRCEMQGGFSAGGFLNMDLVRSFSVQGELLFHYKRSDFDWDNRVGAFRYWGVEIPIYAMYTFALRNDSRLYVGIGPYTEFGLGATFERDGVKGDLYEKDTESGLPALRNSHTGFGLKVGYELPLGLQLNFSYKVSATNLLDANSSTVKMHPHALNIGVAYRFGH